MTQAMQSVPTLSPEDQGRADFYGLIARLFHAAPDARLIGELLAAGELGGEHASPEGRALAAAWRALLEAWREASPDALEEEHTRLFIGTGKAEVTPYVSHYVLRHSSDVPLAQLRGQLAAWGIGRRDGVPEYEDHIAGVCEAMRFAIAVQHRTLQEQKAFFERFLHRAAVSFCDAVTGSGNARFYRPVAQFARAFFDIEKAAFEMVEPDS